MSSLRRNPAVAHIAPLAVFMLLSSLVTFIAVKNAELPWWRSAPEHWVYPLQALVVGVLLVFFWKHYTFRPLREIQLAAWCGIIGIAYWILPAHYYATSHDPDIATDRSIWWLGFVARNDGFNPFIFPEHSAAWWTTVALRFFRLVIIVPLVEEIFWRGFLMRWCVAGDDKPFTSVAMGTHTWKAFLITTAGVVLVHQPEDWLGALVFGSLMYGLCVRTKSLAACVLMHAVANLLLGLYVMKTRQWGFW